MKFPMLPIVIFFVFALFLCALFVPGERASRPDRLTELDIDLSRIGKVLGASESIFDINRDDLDLNLYGMPAKAEPVLPVPPRRREAAGGFSLPCPGAAVDLESGAVLFGRDSDIPMPIASITKLMTALVFLEHNPGWDSVYRIKPSDIVEGGMIYLYVGDRVKVRDLFYLSLVASANSATKALSGLTALHAEQFVEEMNSLADSLGLEKTKFADPVGLSKFNVSTPEEVAELTRYALANEDIYRAVQTSDFVFTTEAGRSREVYSTNSLLWHGDSDNFRHLGGKTGYNGFSGYCFAGEYEDGSGHSIITVVLNSPEINDRFTYSKDLADWVYSSYIWD